MSDLLKTTRASQLFSVFGLPDIQIAKAEDGKLKVELMGVDIYDPNTGETIHESGKKVAAWFLDTDYDGMVFHICQAFFPGGEDPWDKLKAEIDESVFERMRGTESFPFEPGEHKQIAVKVIDFRGNEVMRVEKV
jgi:adenine-specific DNA-methyltransferase